MGGYQFDGLSEPAAIKSAAFGRFELLADGGQHETGRGGTTAKHYVYDALSARAAGGDVAAGLAVRHS